MSSASSAVTYTSVYTDSEPDRAFWGADDEEVSEGGIPRVIVYGYDGLPIQPVAPPSPDYIPGPEDPQTPPVPQDEDECEPMFVQAHDPDFMPEPVYPEYMPLEEEHVFLAEEQPLPPVDSPTAESPGMRTRRDEERTRRRGSTLAPPTHAAVEPYRRLLAGFRLPYPSNPRDRGRQDSSQTTPSHHHHLSHYHHPLQESVLLVTTALPSPPLPPSLYIPSPVDRKDDTPESDSLPTRLGRGTDYGFVSTVDAEERRQGVRDVGYGIRDTWVDPAEAVPEIAPVTLGEVSTRVVELAEVHERNIQDVYALPEDAQDGRSQTVWMVEEEAYASREAWAHSIGLGQVTYQELQTHRDHVYAHETHIQAHQTQLQLQSTLIQTQHQVSETRFQMQQAEIAALRESDRRRQAQMTETLRVLRDMRREMGDMQAELLAHREQQRRARQPGPEARIPDHQDASGDADSHI
ncbi:hypothetical protein Tco_0377671 [Tanacetum coccineum]